MLFINKKLVTREQLAKKFGVNLNKIEKRPEFESTKKIVDRINGGRIKSPAGHNLLCYFVVEDPETRLPMEIRFAESNNQKIVGDRVIDQFKPKQIVFTGSAIALDRTNPADLDRALYLHLYPTNSLSPLRTSRSPRAKHEFIDTTARAEKRINGINEMGEAILHATQVKGQDMLIFAKGLGIPSVENKDEREVRADLMDFAQKQPKLYLEKKNSQLTIIEGRIENFIDKGIFKLEQIGTVRRWSWTAGNKEGEIILDIVNTTQDAKTALKNHIFNDINEYNAILANLTETLSSRAVAEAALKALEAPQGDAETIGEDLPDYLKNPQELPRISVMLPQSFAEATDYVERLTGKRTPAWASKLHNGIKSGEVNEDNIVEFVNNLS